MDIAAEREEITKFDPEERVYCETLLTKIDRLQALAEYADYKHKNGCNPKPWENDCDCGLLKALKEGEK